MMHSRSALYLCQDLCKRRDAEGAGFELRVPELRIQPGEVIVMRGPSGCGKSTLLDMLALALEPDAAARFSFRPGRAPGGDVIDLWRRRRRDELARLRGVHVGYVLQTGGLLSFLTVRENIALSNRLLGRPAGGEMDRLAERLDIARHLEKWPEQLSVGERQRVAIARAMAHRPSVVLADEPTASVDPVNAEVILGLLMELVDRSGATAVIASHDWRPERAVGARLLNHRIERTGDTIRSLFWS